MPTSLFLAQLIGPTLIIMGAGMVASPPDWRAMAEDFLASPALIFLAGLLALVPGLAIVLSHNVWALDWRLIITLIGWLAIVGGAFRILMPRQVRAIGTSMIRRTGWMRGGGAVVAPLGAVLAWFGFVA